MPLAKFSTRFIPVIRCRGDIVMAKFDTVVKMLSRAAEQEPEREALVCEDDRLTYAEYARCVAGFAAELKTVGAAQQRVAILIGNSVDFCIALFAVHACHAQAIPLNPLYTERELKAILTDAAPKILVCDASVVPLVSNLPDVHILSITADSRRLTCWRGDNRLTLSGDFPCGGELANLQYTGGTSGRSKGVNLTHGAIAVNVSQCEELVPTKWAAERLLSVMPLYHVYAMAMCLHKMASCAGTMVIMPSFDVEKVKAALIEERITIFAGSPSLFTVMLTDETFRQIELPHLSYSLSGGSSLPAELLQQVETVTKRPVLEGYGQSEAGPVISFNPLNGQRKPLSVGIPLPGVEVQIVDSERGDTLLAVEEAGEIRVRGPQIMSGYRNLPGETALTLRDGWLYTSDIGRFDCDGYLYICDRKKEMILVSGFNVFPREVEEVLYSHNSVKEAAVIGVPHEVQGETVKAYVALHADAKTTVAELAGYCRTNLAAYKVPKIIEFIDVLPKTAVNKIDKKKLKSI